ncbi:MAG TPA: hypothetical protein ENI52_03580 [Thermoplasmata archaeon]|nr:hypothetical protein [Thermoplasmata archaeon]
MNWNNWVLNRQAKDNPPNEWIRILEYLKKILPDRLINKIEFTAFVIKGKRTARWILNRDHPEYCTKNEALQVAKKLTWQMLLSKGSPPINPELKELLLCDNEDCKLFIGHEGRCNTEEVPFGITRCHLCKKIIYFEDFDRDAKRDPLSIQIGHSIPLSRTTRGHNVRNVVWAHRKCNQIQSEQTLYEVLENMSTILEAHGYTIEKRYF